jgi:hypothetical protein
VRITIAGLRTALRLPWRTILRSIFTDNTASHKDLDLTVMDWRPRLPEGAPEPIPVVSDALRRISAAGQGFGELVASHLRTVIITHDLPSEVVPGTRAWVTNFSRAEARNSHYLACRLIWVATATRLARDAKRSGKPLDSGQVRRACWDAQRRFLLQFEDAERWIEHMDPDNHETDDPPTGGAA